MPRPLAQPDTASVIRLPMPITTVACNIARAFISPPCGYAGRSPPRGGARLLADLVADRGNGLEVLRDRHQVLTGHVFVAGRPPLDPLPHGAPRHVTVGLVAGAEVVGDLLDRPLA